MKKVQNSKILVTGGAGFIGSNLVERLLSQGNQVRVLDNFATGKMENLVPFIGNPSFQLIVGDIRDMAKCREAVDGMDYVLHEAALGSVPRSIKDPMTTTEVNIVGFVNMLYAAAEAKVKRFVYAASSSTYGDTGNGYHVPVKAVLHAGFKIDTFLPSDDAGQERREDVEKPFEKDDDREDGYQCENVEQHVSFPFSPCTPYP